MAAAMTEPPGPGRSPPPLIHVGWIRNASSMALTPPSLMPPPLIPGYVDRPSMSSMVSPASAIASRLASTASASGSTISRRPKVERPMPLRTARCSKRSSLRGARGSGRTGSATRSTGSTDPVSSKRGSHTSSCCRNGDRDLLADLHLGRLAADDVRRQVHAGVLGQRDVGDDVGRVEVGQPAVGVDRGADDGAAARHRGRLRRPAPAVGADGHRRMHQLAAVAALLDAERAVGTGGPEPLVGRGQLRQGPHRRSSPGRPTSSIDIDVAIEHARHVTCQRPRAPKPAGPPATSTAWDDPILPV